MKSQVLPKSVMWVGIILILITGLIHLSDAPDNFEESTYKGVLFVLNGLGSLLAAYGIYRGVRSWGWTLGMVIAAASIILYIASRTVGLPGLEVDDDWFEPMGVVAMLAEILFVGVFLYAMSRYNTAALESRSTVSHSSLRS